MVILASGSPRRRQLLADMQIPHRILLREVDESFPNSLAPALVPAYLARKKAEAYTTFEIGADILLTADTVVILGGQILNKPADAMEAKAMLTALSGRSHTVVTAACFREVDLYHSISDSSIVHIRPFSKEEIDFYVDNYQPFDKAGAYGIQDWFGLVGIEKIDGSHYTVMGLPTHLVYDYLSRKLTVLSKL